MSLKYSLHTGCTFQLVSLFAEKNLLLLFISGWKELKQQKESEPFISLQMRFTIRDSITASQGEWIISFDDFVALGRLLRKPHKCYANLGDQSSYPVTAMICASIFRSTKLDGNKLLEMVSNWGSQIGIHPFIIHLSFIYVFCDWKWCEMCISFKTCTCTLQNAAFEAALKNWNNHKRWLI